MENALDKVNSHQTYVLAQKVIIQKAGKLLKIKASQKKPVKKVGGQETVLI